MGYLKDRKMDQNNGVSLVAEPKQGTDNPTGCIDGTRQTSHLNHRWNWVETSIWTDNMLAALGNGVKGGCWFSLIDKVFRPTTLLQAWQKVKQKKGAGGVDKISIKKFEANCTKYLSELSKELREDTYRPMAVRRVYIPKGDGKTRPLGIPTVKDRVVQAALKMVVEPIFENDFHGNSYGFRPGRNQKDALREVDRHLKNGFVHVVDVDIQGYFDSIPHDRLMVLVEEKISDSRVLSLIQNFLKQGVMEELETWTPIKGTPQGGVISPLLANLYLNQLDHLMANQGYAMIRYADDFVILTRKREEAELAKEEITKWVESVGLIVHPEKTKLVDYGAGEGFDFLGYRFIKGLRLVRAKSLKKLRDSIRAKTRRTDGRAMKAIIEELNLMLRGWYNYFKQAHYSVLRQTDQMVRRRLRAIYRKREKRPGFGRTRNDHRRWPNSHFAKLGLFTTLQAHKQDLVMYKLSLACQSR